MRLADTVSLSPPFAKASKRGGSPDRLQQLSGLQDLLLSNCAFEGTLPSRANAAAWPSHDGGRP